MSILLTPEEISVYKLYGTEGFAGYEIEGLLKAQLKKGMDDMETDFIFIKELIANRENDTAIAHMIERWQSLLKEVE